jgi:hypothetical protein
MIKTMQCSKQTRFGFGGFEISYNLRFILAPDCFEFRHSDFGFEFFGYQFVSDFDIRISSLLE